MEELYNKIITSVCNDHDVKPEEADSILTQIINAMLVFGKWCDGTEVTSFTEGLKLICDCLIDITGDENIVETISKKFT